MISKIIREAIRGGHVQKDSRCTSHRVVPSNFTRRKVIRENCDVSLKLIVISIQTVLDILCVLAQLLTMHNIIIIPRSIVSSDLRRDCVCRYMQACKSTIYNLWQIVRECIRNVCVRACQGACASCAENVIASNVLYFAFEGYFHPRRSCISMLSRYSIRSEGESLQTSHRCDGSTHSERVLRSALLGKFNLNS